MQFANYWFNAPLQAGTWRACSGDLDDAAWYKLYLTDSEERKWGTLGLVEITKCVKIPHQTKITHRTSSE